MQCDNGITDEIYLDLRNTLARGGIMLGNIRGIVGEASVIAGMGRIAPFFAVVGSYDALFIIEHKFFSLRRFILLFHYLFLLTF